MKKKILIKSSFELIAIITGITLSFWVNDYQNYLSQSKHNIRTLISIKFHELHHFLNFKNFNYTSNFKFLISSRHVA